MKKMILRWACLFLTLCTMAMIFYFSSENGKESGAASEGVTAFLVRLFSGKEMSELSEKALATISLVIRKLAHFSEFFLLGVFSGGFIRSYKMKKWLHFALPSAFCLAYAAFDGCHQLFVSGRSGSVRDVMIDFSGSLAAGLALMLIAHIIKKKNTSKAEGT